MRNLQGLRRLGALDGSQSVTAMGLDPPQTATERAQMRGVGTGRGVREIGVGERAGDFAEPPSGLLEHLVQVYAFSDEEAQWWWRAGGPSVVG